MKNKVETRKMQNQENVSNHVGVGVPDDPTVSKHTSKLMSNILVANSKHSKSETAITLVALAITIIVLLILAGITLSILLGENGVIQRARKAKENTNKAAAIEDVKLAWSQTKIKYETRPGEEETKKKEEYYTKENIQNSLAAGKIPEEEGSFIYKENGTSKVVYENSKKERYIIEIDENGNVYVKDNSEIKPDEEFVSTAHKVTINKGSTYQITSSSGLEWESGNTNIATIKNENEKVIITGANAGSTIITGKNKNGTTVVECNITVFEQSATTYVWKVYGVNSSSTYGYKYAGLGNTTFYNGTCYATSWIDGFDTKTRII